MSKVDQWKRPDGSLSMNAYYYAFDTTDCEPVDRVLSAVACAGEAAHHTDSWSDGPPGESLVDEIQHEADEAAKAFARLTAENARLRKVVEALRGHAWRTVADAGFVSETLAELAQGGHVMDPLTDNEIRALMARLEYARLDIGMAMLTFDDKTTPTLRAEIEKARAKCAALFRAWPKEGT